MHTSSVHIRSRNRPRRRLLVHLSQAVETLALAKAPSTHVVPLKGSLDGSLKLQSFDVSSREFDHFLNISCRPAIFDIDVAALRPSELGQPLNRRRALPFAGPTPERRRALDGHHASVDDQ